MGTARQAFLDFHFTDAFAFVRASCSRSIRAGPLVDHGALDVLPAVGFPRGLIWDPPECRRLLNPGGSVMESITIRAGIATDPSPTVKNVGLMSNTKMTPPRIWSMAPGL